MNTVLKKSQKRTKDKAGAENNGNEKYILKLFVTGLLPNSRHAIANIKAICEKYLIGRYELEIIDIYQQPSLATTEEVIAIPALVKKFPLPEERLIGDLSDTEMVLKELNIIINSNPGNGKR